MADLQRLMWFFVGIFFSFAFWMPPAHADYPASEQWCGWDNYLNQCSYGASPEAACAGITSGGDYVPYNENTSCRNQFGATRTLTQSGYQCPYGGTLSGTTCLGGNPPVDCSTKSGQKVPNMYTSAGAVPGMVVDADGCQMEIISGNTCAWANGDPGCTVGIYRYTGEEGTNEPAAAAGPPPEQQAPSSCKTGTCPGTINGVHTCLPCGTGTGSSENINTTTTTNPDGTSTSVITTTNYNSTTNTTTTTTTTTTYGADGTQTGQETTTTEEPGPPSEESKSAHGPTDCGTPPSCSGDAIQCAISRQLWDARCTQDEFTQAYTDLKDEGLGEDTNLNIGATVQGSATHRYAAICPGDTIVQVPGAGSFAIPWSNLCPYWEILGNILLAVAGIVSVRIVAGAV